MLLKYNRYESRDSPETAEHQNLYMASMSIFCNNIEHNKAIVSHRIQSGSLYQFLYQTA